MPELHIFRLPVLLLAVEQACSTAGLVAAETSQNPKNMQIYVGTYTSQNSKGIYQFDFDPATGKAGKPKLAVEVVNPSF